MSKESVNEGTSSTIRATFRDQDGVLSAPTTAQYRIHCQQNKQEIRAWTALVPAAEIDIDLLPADNACVTSRVSEQHEVTVRATYGGGQQVTGRYVYDVKNLRFL